MQPVRELADGLGADAGQLSRIAQCMARIRELAALYCLDYPDRRDYLAVLYLTTLRLLQYAGDGVAPPANYHLLTALVRVLDNRLCRILNVLPYDWQTGPVDCKRLITRQWLSAPGTPGRVVYFANREDGRNALGPVAATQRILQSQNHHLDVFDHTLLTMAYLEELFAGPLQGLLHPAKLDHDTAAALGNQGIQLPAIPAHSATPPDPNVPEAALLRTDREALAAHLRGRGGCTAEVGGILHDVGKVGTRTFNGTNDHVKVQFFGHEVYGLQLVRKHLQAWFPQQDDRKVVEHLIRWHHDHHTMVDELSTNPERLASLCTGLNGRLHFRGHQKFLRRQFETKHGTLFPHLILLGFTDFLACRGPDRTVSIHRAAEIDLVLLAWYVRWIGDANP